MFIPIVVHVYEQSLSLVTAVALLVSLALYIWTVWIRVLVPNERDAVRNKLASMRHLFERLPAH